MSITQFMPNGTIHLYRDDLPEGLSLGPVVAVDTETMGLNPHRDRLCLVQLSSGDGHAHLVQLIPPEHGGQGYTARPPDGPPWWATGCPGGGIGRRAGFRYLWPQGRGSSSLLLGTNPVLGYR